MPSAPDGPNYIDLYVGARIRMRRKILGLSQERLADDLGITFQQVQKYERGTNRISASKLYAAARTLRVPVSFFFNGLVDRQGAADADLPKAAHLVAFLETQEGVELLQLFPRIGKSRDRRRILDLIHALTESGPDDEA